MKNRNANPNLRPVPINRTSPPPSRKKKNEIQNSSLRYGSSNTTRSDFSNPSITDHISGPPTTSTGVLPSSSYPNISGLSSSLYTSMKGLSNPSYTDSVFPGSSYANTILSGSSSTSVLLGNPHTNKDVFPDPSNYNMSFRREPAVASKHLNIDEFGNMDSDNEEDAAYPIHHGQVSKSVIGDSIDGVPISELLREREMPRNAVDFSIDGVPISDSMMPPLLPSTMNYGLSRGSQSRSSDLGKRSSREDEYVSCSSTKMNFPKDPQSALQSFIEALKDPESFTNKSKGGFMQTPISSLVREKYMPSDGYVDPASSDRDEFNRFDAMEQASLSMKGRFIRPDDSFSNLSSNERRTDHSPIQTMSQPDVDYRGILAVQKTGMKPMKAGSSVIHHGPGASDRRTDVSHSRQEPRSKNLSRENQESESRSDDICRSRKTPRESSSRSSKGSKKDEIKSVKLSWHSTPVDRRKGESEEQERDRKNKNPLLKGLKQASKLGLGKAVSKERNQPSVSGIFESPSDVKEDDDDDSAPTRNIIVDNMRYVPSDTPSQSFLQNAVGMPPNVIPQEQGFMQKMNIGLQGNLMVPPDQGFALNNMGLPGNYAFQPEQRFVQSSGVGIASNIWPPDQRFIQNTNMGLSGHYPSALQSIQEDLRQQEAFVIQSGVMHQSALHNVQQPAIQERQQTAMQGIARAPLNSMAQQSMETQRTMAPSVTQNKRSLTRFSPVVNSRSPSVTQNKVSTATKSAPPFILNPSVPPPATPVKSFNSAHNDVTKSTTITPSVNQVMMKLAPDGTGSVKYPAPDTNLLTFDPDIGYRYDTKTGLHYDANSGYFFNSELKIFLYWDLFTQTYLRVENPTIPFPVLRNKNESSNDQQNIVSSGAIINMKKLIEQHRQMKLEQDKANQDMFARSRRSSHSGSRGRENRRSRSRKRRASPSRRDEQKKRQRGSISPRRPTPKRRTSRSPKTVRRSDSPTSRKTQRRDDKLSVSPSSRRRLASPGSSARKWNDRRRSGSPDNRRRPLRSPRRRSHSRSPTGVSKKRSVSPRKRDERRRSGSPDNTSRRRPLLRSPSRRQSHSKSPPGLLSRKKDNRKRSNSPFNNRRHPVSRSPVRRRSRSLTPSRVSKRRSPSPGSLTRKREGRRKKSHTPDRKPRLPGNLVKQPSLKVTVLNPLARDGSIESKGTDKQESNSKEEIAPIKETLDDYVKDYANWGKSTEEVNSTSVPPKSKWEGDEQIPPPKSSLVHKNSEEIGVSGMKPESSTADVIGQNESISLTKGKAMNRSDKEVAEKLDVSKKESESTSRRRPRACVEGLAIKNNESRDTASKANDGKSKSTRRNSSLDKQKNDEKQITSRNDSRGSGIRYTSHKDKDTKSVDTKLERRERENTSRNAKTAKRKEDSPSNEGRNHRLVSERQFSGSGTKFSFPRDEVSQSKPRPSSQFDPFLSVEPVNDDTEQGSIMSVIPDDLSDFVVLDGIEDEEDESLEENGNNADMIEEELQLLLADDNDPKKNNNESPAKEELISDGSCLDEEPSASTIDPQNQDENNISKKSAVTGLQREPPITPSSKTRVDNENHGEITALKVTTELLSTQTEKTMLGESELQQKTDVKSDERSSLQLMNSYSQPPSPASSIYSSYNFSDDENFVTVSAVGDEAEVTISAVEDEEVAVSAAREEGEESKSLTNKTIRETEDHSFEQMKFKEQECAKVTLNDHCPKLDDETVGRTLDSSKNMNCKKTVKPLEVSCSEGGSSTSMVTSNAAPQKPGDEALDVVIKSSVDAQDIQTEEVDVVIKSSVDAQDIQTEEVDVAIKSSVDAQDIQTEEVDVVIKSSVDAQDIQTEEVDVVIKSSVDAQDIQTEEDNDLKQQEVKPDKEGTCLKIEPSLKVVGAVDGTSQLDGSEVLIKSSSQDIDKNTVVSQSIEEHIPATVSEPVEGDLAPDQKENEQDESLTQTGMKRDVKEEDASPDTKVLQRPNEEQTDCSVSSELVKEEKCPSKVEPVRETDKEANVSQGKKKVRGVFSRLGEPSKAPETDNRVPGDTDPLSKLYGNTPTRFVHLKTSIGGLPWKLNVVRESLYHHLFTNDIVYMKASVNTKNNLGCPFEFLQVTFESAAQAEQWFLKTGRKITLQQTQHMKVDYYMYYAQPPWSCKYCSRVQNVFFRSLCYVCFCHKSGSFTNVRFTDEPTKFVGVIKLPATVNESNVLQHLHQSTSIRQLKSVRIVEDPQMKCCCGLVVVELPTILEAMEVHRWSLKKNPNQILRYVEVDDDISDSSTPKVVFRDGILAKSGGPGAKQEAGSSRVGPKQHGIQDVDENEDRRNLRSSRPIKDSVPSRAHRDISLSSSNCIYDEIGIPPDFEDYDGSNHSYDDLEVSHRLVEYNPGQDSGEKDFIDPSLSPLQYERSVSPSFDDYVNPLERGFSPSRGSTSRGHEGRYRSRSRGRERSRGRRSPISPGDPHPSSRCLSPPRRPSPQRYRSPPQRYRSPPRRISPERRHSPRRYSPPRLISPERRHSPRRYSPPRLISPERRHSPRRYSPPRLISPERRHSPRRYSPPRLISPERRHSPRRYSPPRRSPPLRGHSPPRRSPPLRGHSPPLVGVPTRLPVPDGRNNEWIYPLPDTSRFQFETHSGLYYDPETTLYYDFQTRLFYNGDLNIYLEYDPINYRYLRVS